MSKVATAAKVVVAAATTGTGASAAGVAKEFKGKAGLLIMSGEAKPGPTIGQALGPLGVNMAEFCKQFNADTQKFKPGIPLRVSLTAYKDRTFSYAKNGPPTTWYLKRCANIDKGAAKPKFESVGTVTLKQCYEIAKMKKIMNENEKDHELIGLVRSVAGSCRSLGIEVIKGDQVSLEKWDAEKSALEAALAKPKADKKKKDKGAKTFGYRPPVHKKKKM